MGRCSIKHERLPWGHNYKFRVTEPFLVKTPVRPEKTIVTEYYVLTKTGWAILLPGYCWNGDDCAVDCKSSRAASAVHDMFCQLIKEGLLDWGWMYLINSFYKHMCLKDGMWPWHADFRRFWLKVYWDFKRKRMGVPAL